MPKASNLPSEVLNKLPEGLVRFADNPSNRTLDELFPGETYSGLRASLKDKGEALYRGTKVIADLDSAGKVVTMAAAVPRLPPTSEDYLLENVPDFARLSIFYNTNADFGLRRQRLALFRQVAATEGMINNAIKKTTSLIAQDGSFKIRYAKQGKRPKGSVISDLGILLKYWTENLNADDIYGIITGSSGLKQVIRRGARQAMIEGDLFLRQVWMNTKVPILGDSKTFSLPLTLQAIPASDIYVPPPLYGTGLEIFYWRPQPRVLMTILNPRSMGAFVPDDEIKQVITKVVTPKVREQLLKYNMVRLDPKLLTHIKHSNTDTDVFGQSIIEPAITDLAYARALKALDFVTIESLINRLTVIKIGDPNPDSDYHNIAVAQQRVNTFRKLLDPSIIGPNMMIVWAGHDVEAVDISAHNELLDTTGRHEFAKESLKMSLGVPDSILIGEVGAGGKGAGWAGFIALDGVAEELRDEWTQTITHLGRRIAFENGFDEVDLTYEFHKNLLVDKEANAKIMVQAYDRGLLSKRSMLEELDKDFDAERLRRQEEKDDGDVDLFVPPPNLKGGPGGIQGGAPGSEPGRPSKPATTKIGPDRQTKVSDTTK